MSIKTITTTVHQCFCDKCGDVFIQENNGGGRELFEDLRTLNDLISEHWFTSDTGEYHFCQDCCKRFLDSHK